MPMAIKKKDSLSLTIDILKGGIENRSLLTCSFPYNLYDWVVHLSSSPCYASDPLRSPAVCPFFGKIKVSR